MWRDLEKMAIQIGLDLFYFWNLTPKQFTKYVEVYNEQQENNFKDKDRLNWLLGKYIAFSYNDPKNYPKKPFLDSLSLTSEIMTDDDMERVARHNTLRLGGKIN